MKVSIVIGARPNIFKVIGILREFAQYDDIHYELVHTGQHYDHDMSGAFLEEFDLNVDHDLSVGSGSHGEQTSKIIKSFEEYCLRNKPDLVIVTGDVNSTMGCAIAVSKIPDIKLAHIEAGVRRSTLDYPEEVNRRVTDLLSDFLFCTTFSSVYALVRENIFSDKIFLVGDTMIDNLLDVVGNIDETKLKKRNQALVELHRPYNVDDKDRFKEILLSLNEILGKTDVLFTLHPRARQNLERFELKEFLGNIQVLNPLNKYNFVKTMMESKCVITDSGGIQIESTALNIPCITVNNETVHKETIDYGTNTLVDCPKLIPNMVYSILRGEGKQRLNYCDEFVNDGFASKRIVNILRRKML